MHLIAKLLDHMDDEAMKDAGFSFEERIGARRLYNVLDDHLTAVVGKNWDELEAPV
jgi:hypothetical protein